MMSLILRRAQVEHLLGVEVPPPAGSPDSPRDVDDSQEARCKAHLLELCCQLRHAAPSVQSTALPQPAGASSACETFHFQQKSHVSPMGKLANNPLRFVTFSPALAH